MVKKCIICNDNFDAKGSGKCCSYKCSVTNNKSWFKKNHRNKYKKRTHTKKCVVCENLYKGHGNSTTCSSECFKRNKKKYLKKYYKNNKKKWTYIYNPEQCKARYNYKIKNDIGFKLNLKMGNSIRKYLKSKGVSKNKKHWESLVGYSKEELKSHLEKLFTEGMTWKNHGDWHIDHVKPKSLFNITSNDCQEFKMCWRLENLQPLWAKDNLSKGVKYETPT